MKHFLFSSVILWPLLLLKGRKTWQSGRVKSEAGDTAGRAPEGLGGSLHQAEETTSLGNLSNDLAILEKLYKDLKTHKAVSRARVPRFHKSVLNSTSLCWFFYDSMPLTLSEEAGRLAAIPRAAMIKALGKREKLCSLATNS